MNKQTLFVGYFVADGKVQDLCVYHIKDCARDTILESMGEYAEEHPEQQITEVTVLETDDDGSVLLRHPVE